ncbi:tPR domain protein [Prevotella sp. CAG:924]|nr:tPR domain protein [Prevotella sp. CAG:924]
MPDKREDIIPIDPKNVEMQQALQLIQFTRQSLFLTGKAGTGKSTFLRYIAATTKKKYIILAPTGIAAINAGGSTLHSFFKLPFYPLVPTDIRYTPRHIRQTLKYNKEKIKIIRELELLIIDEISMVRADMLDFIDKVLRIYSGNMREPFGGKQLLMVGDVYQLEPVVTSDARQILEPFYPSAFFFYAHVFRQMPLVSIELRKVYRQSDPTFISILDHIRVSQVSDTDLALLNKRVEQNGAQTEQAPQNQDSPLSITLSARRDVVDYINRQELDALEGGSEIFQGIIEGDFPQSSLPTPQELEMKLGAQILFVKNDIDHRWVNGTLGTVIGFDDDTHDVIYIRTEKGKEYAVERAKWANVRYRYNDKEKKIEEEEIGTYEQFPIRLAWAITVHKSQGLTFSRVRIDFSGGVFAGGQTYVALSRCTSLEGIQLKAPIQRSDIFVRNEVAQFATRYNDNHAIAVALKQSKADKEYYDAVQAFDRGNMQEALDSFFLAIHSRYDIEKPVARRYIRRKLDIINRQRKEIEALKEAAHKKDEYLKRLAVEYVIMAKDCEHEGMREAALRNYEKALELCPDLPEAKRKVEKLKADMS